MRDGEVGPLVADKARARSKAARTHVGDARERERWRRNGAEGYDKGENRPASRMHRTHNTIPGAWLIPDRRARCWQGAGI